MKTQTKKKKIYEDIKEMVLTLEAENKIVLLGIGGFISVDLDEIIKQPTEGLLYDLNRDRLTILTFIRDKKWVNDFACMKVIEKLKEHYDRTKNENTNK